MKTHNLKLHVLAALLACGSVFHVGCGDDDDNATPSNTGGKASGTGGKASGTGGKASGTGGTGDGTGGTGDGTGGKATGTGGKDAGTGGLDGTAGAGEGGGGPEITGGAGGGTGTPEGGTPGTGGSGGEAGGGGAPDVLPPCTTTHYDDTNECYAECEPKTNSSSEQFLNRCSEAKANCTKFDNSTLSKLGANGTLPPLP